MDGPSAQSEGGHHWKHTLSDRMSNGGDRTKESAFSARREGRGWKCLWCRCKQELAPTTTPAGVVLIRNSQVRGGMVWGTVPLADARQ